MIEVTYAALTVEHTRIADRPLQPFTQELLNLHQHVFDDPSSNVIAYTDKHKVTRTARHRTVANMILNASLIMPIAGTMDNRSSIYLGVKTPEDDEMSLALPVRELPQLDMQDDPFASLIADYFRSHVQAPGQRTILLA